MSPDLGTSLPARLVDGKITEGGVGDAEVVYWTFMGYGDSAPLPCSTSPSGPAALGLPYRPF